MNSYVLGVGQVIWVGVKACLTPLIFDVAMSIYVGKPNLYAPFLWPLFFFLGIIMGLDRLRRARRAEAISIPRERQ
jgi:hypothetical protein